MIGVIFNLGTQNVEVRVQESNVFFRTSQVEQFADISGIKLDKEGVVKEFPDLKDKKDWKDQAIKRFKKNIRKMKNEKERIEYLIEELSKQGYKPIFLQKKGFRTIRL